MACTESHCSQNVWPAGPQTRARLNLASPIASSETPVEWVVIDMSPVNVVDVTAVRKMDELREQLRAQGIHVVIARVQPSLAWGFEKRFAEERLALSFPTLKAAVRAFKQRGKEDAMGEPPPDDADEDMDEMPAPE